MSEGVSSQQQTLHLSVDAITEQVVIAAACVDRPTLCRLVARLGADQFLVPRHKAIWEALAEMVRRGLEFDPATLQQVAGDRVDVGYLQQLCEMRPEVPANLPFHVDQLQWDRVRASAASGPLSLLLEAVRNPREAPDRVRALARATAAAFEAAGGGRQHLHDPAALVAAQLDDVRARMEGRSSFPYGLDGLDLYEGGRRRMVPGAAPGQLTVVTGVAGSGKSTLTARLCLGMARQRRRVLYGAWEMSGGTTLELLSCLSLGWSRSDMVEGRIPADALPELRRTMDAIGAWVTFARNPFRRRSGEKASNERNLDVVHGLVADSGCDVFIADLWKRCLASAKPEEEEEALYRQQAMAEELGVHAVLVQQQRLKDIEHRQDRRPTREGVKGSAAWVEVADTMIAPHRPALFKRIPDDRLEVFVLKQRYGKWPVGVEFRWDPDKGSVEGGRSIEYESLETSEGDAGGPLGMRNGKERSKRSG